MKIHSFYPLLLCVFVIEMSLGVASIVRGGPTINRRHRALGKGKGGAPKSTGEDMDVGELSDPEEQSNDGSFLELVCGLLGSFQTESCDALTASKDLLCPDEYETSKICESHVQDGDGSGVATQAVLEEYCEPLFDEYSGDEPCVTYCMFFVAAEYGDCCEFSCGNP